MAKQAPQRPQPRAPQPQRVPQPPQTPARKSAPTPAPARREKRERKLNLSSQELIFGRQNFLYMGIGLALILVGLLAMAGGAMPDPNKWEPERIYSFQRITLAPILMVAGFVVIIVGIFKKNNRSAAIDSDNVTAI
ncbi:MAG: DUF3098 domain-containing protein [Saprospiraceae bacterium]|nr:DUF3098 domain-containing protein [Saprospiraceae bacterium]